MPVSTLKQGIVCPVHGSPCQAAEIARRKFRKTGVLFLGKAWVVHARDSTTHDRDDALVKIHPSGVLSRGDRGACVPLDNRQAVLNVAFSRFSSVDQLRRELNLSVNRIRAYLKSKGVSG